MPANILDTVASPSVGALKRSAPVANSATAQKTVVTQYTSTSISGKVTTVTTYSDGSTKTTVSEGDTVILSTKRPISA
jgi:hypothetical protein